MAVSGGPGSRRGSMEQLSPRWPPLSFLGDVGSAARRVPPGSDTAMHVSLCLPACSVRWRCGGVRATRSDRHERAAPRKPPAPGAGGPSPTDRSIHRSAVAVAVVAQPRALPPVRPPPPYVCMNPRGPQPAASLPVVDFFYSNPHAAAPLHSMICFRSGDMIGMRRRDRMGWDRSRRRGSHRRRLPRRGLVAPGRKATSASCRGIRGCCGPRARRRE